MFHVHYALHILDDNILILIELEKNVKKGQKNENSK